MICPYCKTNLKAGSQFCQNCGQAIVVTDNTEHTDKYWKEVDMLNEENEHEYLSIMRNAKSESRSKALSSIFKSIAFVIVVAVVVMGVYAKNVSNQKKLEVVRIDAIGNTFSDTSGIAMLLSGDKRERISVNFMDKDRLSYTRGNYTFHIADKDDGGYSTSWTENEIYENEEYEYSFSISFFGKITLKFDGKSYKVTPNDDGTIRYISLYDD